MNNEDLDIEFEEAESLQGKNFTIIPNMLLQNKYNLPGDCYQVICYLLSHRKGWFAYKSSIMTTFDMGEKRVRTALKELKSRGFVRTTPKRQTDGTLRGWTAQYSNYPTFLAPDSEKSTESGDLNRRGNIPTLGAPPRHNNTNTKQYCSNNINNVPSQTALSNSRTEQGDGGNDVSNNKRACATIRCNEMENDVEEVDEVEVDVDFNPASAVFKSALDGEIADKKIERDDPSELYRVKEQFQDIRKAFDEEAAKRPSQQKNALRNKLSAWGAYENQIEEWLSTNDHKYLTALVSHVESIARSNPGALFHRLLRDNWKIPPSTTTIEQSPRQEPKRVVIPLDESKAWYKAMTDEQKTGWIDRAKRQFPFLDGHISHGKVGFLDHEFTESSAFKVFLDVIGRPYSEGY